MSSISIWDRKNGRINEEKVFGGALIELGYGNPIGRRVISISALQKVVSKLVGTYYSSKLSVRDIAPFIEQYGIRIQDFVVPAEGFASFNDFFIRLFKPALRSYPQNARDLGAPAEGRLTVFEIRDFAATLTIKGQQAKLHELVGTDVHIPKDGHVWVFRLCPLDYHRFHFPDAGTVRKQIQISGLLHSVNPEAQKAFPDLFFKNERQVCVLQSAHFGELLLIEVGALCVGLIQQSPLATPQVQRGQEKGAFLFGASTVILVTHKDQVTPDADLIQRSLAGMESLVCLGEKIGESANTASR